MTTDPKEERYKKYGWKINEINLSTLPETAPEAAQYLTKWLTLEGRRSSLAEWLGCVAEDSRIHGKFWHIGSWTGRMSHSAPNQANIFAPFHGTPKNAVEEVKAKYDYTLRDLWTTDRVLVGTDLDAAQLRILTHYMRSPRWKEAIMTGDKKLGTDIHSMNMKALGPVCRDRDTAKTFIYAWLLGASIGKIAEIFGCSHAKAKEANDNFLAAFPELKKIKEHKIPMDASRGYFIGLDGRKVQCDSEHLMLAGYLQSGESTVVKHWVLEWTKLAREVGLWFRLVDIVHDEVQVEVNTVEDANTLSKLQKQAINTVSSRLELFIPMDIESKVGYSWAECH